MCFGFFDSVLSFAILFCSYRPCQQGKAKRSYRGFVTVVISIIIIVLLLVLFVRVGVFILVFALRVIAFHVIILLKLLLRCCTDVKHPRYGDSAFASELECTDVSWSRCWRRCGVYCA